MNSPLTELSVVEPRIPTLTYAGVSLRSEVTDLTMLQAVFGVLVYMSFLERMFPRFEYIVPYPS